MILDTKSASLASDKVDLREKKNPNSLFETGSPKTLFVIEVDFPTTKKCLVLGCWADVKVYFILNSAYVTFTKHYVKVAFAFV